MLKFDLSIIIPGRSEMFLGRTVQDILKNMRGNTEIIIGCDGNWPSSIVDHPKVCILYHSTAIGQRAMIQECARLSKSKYLMKVDAHCCFDEGFDVKMMSDMQDNWTMVPLMKDLNNQDVVYCFDADLNNQVFNERQETKEDIIEIMSLHGSCFMVTRDKFHELNLCDEILGVRGSLGIEVAVKTWLSGGCVISNKKTWYDHIFRKQSDFSNESRRQVDRTKKALRDLFFQNKWSYQIYKFSWLLEKFWPVPGWSDDDRMAVREQGKGFKVVSEVPTLVLQKKVTKGLCFYTDNEIDPVILSAVQKQLDCCVNGNSLVTVSLKPLNFGENVVMNLKRGHLAMAKQQLAGIEALKTDIVFMVEHDILYPPCHFYFVPPRKDVFYYNLNWWKVRVSDGQALHFKAKQVSGLCAYREILLEYFKNRVRMIESGEIGGRRHFEPGSRFHDSYGKLTSNGFETWWSEIPYVDIRHDTVITRNIFDPKGYRGRVIDWTMADEVPYWGKTKGRFSQFLQEAVEKGVVNE